MKCKIVGHDQVDSGTASLPPGIWTALGLPGISDRNVLVESGGKRRVFTPVLREGAHGSDQVWLSPGALGVTANPVDGVVTLISPKQAKMEVLFHTRRGLLSLVGAVVVFGGVVLQIINTLGDNGVWDFSKFTEAIIGVIAIVCAAGGTAIVFWQSISDRTPQVPS